MCMYYIIYEPPSNCSKNDLPDYKIIWSPAKQKKFFF